MVKLIATDLDGTLLDADGALPEEIFALIEQLSAHSVLFAPASGRQYANLKQLFLPVWDKLVFICEDGALVKYQDRTICLNPIADTYIKPTLDEIRAIPHLHPMLCGTDFAYIEESASPFYTLSVNAYTNCKKVADLDSVIGTEDICKIAVYDDLPAAEHCIRILPPRLKFLRTILSGQNWCDVCSPTVNKGNALRLIRRAFHLEKEECVAFGDHMNDYEMLMESGRAYVTENAYPPLKKMIMRTVPSNREGGVIITIKKLLLQQGVTL